MRITGGVARGIPIVAPRGDAVRPATDGLRQAVFSSLAARLPGAWFLDLFAGSGAYGLEAWSRGAAGGTWVEKNRKAATCVRSNLAAVARSLGRPPAADGLAIAQADVLAWSPPAGGRAPQLVFVDPPYEIITDVAPRVFARVAEWTAAVGDPVIAFETPGEITLAAPGWRQVHRVGGTAPRQPGVSFFRRAET